ncbi:MAG: hypothetical protein ACF8SC_07055 [Phycisphaerales bacterium JB037]
MMHSPNNRSSFARRLGVYLFGVAIGLVMLGALQARRNQAAQRLEAEKQREQERREQLVDREKTTPGESAADQPDQPDQAGRADDGDPGASEDARASEPDGGGDDAGG